MNTDQGSELTSLEFTDLSRFQNIQISVDGKGCWRDNMAIDRFGHAVKYETV